MTIVYSVQISLLWNLKYTAHPPPLMLNHSSPFSWNFPDHFPHLNLQSWPDFGTIILVSPGFGSRLCGYGRVRDRFYGQQECNPTHWSQTHQRPRLWLSKDYFKNIKTRPQGQLVPLVMYRCNLCWHTLIQPKYSPQADTVEALS